MMKKKLLTFIIVSVVLTGGLSIFSMSVSAPDPQYLPDLTISQENITFSKSTFIAGSPVTIDATVWNVGNADASSVEVRFYEEDTLIGSKNVDVPVNWSWMNYILDLDYDVGFYSSIANDSLNGIHVCYVDWSNNALKYAYRPKGGSWDISTVDSGFVVESPSLAVDSGDGVHISYHDNSAQELKYAYKPNGGSWSFEIVASPPGDPGKYSSIAVDSLNGVHISYVDTNTYDLCYAYKPSGGSWTNWTIDGGYNVIYTSIAIDGADGAHISYHDYSAKDLKYAIKPSGGSWATYTIDSTGEVGTYSSIAVDEADGVHISYCDFLNGDLKYAYKPDGGSWTNQTIDDVGYVGEYSSIAIDDAGGIHISYYDSGNFDLKYAYISNGGNWTNHTIDSPGNVGWHTSITIDGTGGIHISYFDLGNTALKYANKIAPPGNIQTSISWIPTIAGLRNITVKIDEDNAIEELNETNNNATVSVTVEPGYNGTIVIEPSSGTLELNETQQFNATGVDYYGNEASISVIWYVSGGGTIDQNGLFTALYPGEWDVQAVDEDQPDYMGEAPVTVQVNMTADTDLDGILDWWEVVYGLDPFNGSDADIDPDLDGLTNLQEFLNYSDPYSTDSDGDNLGDGFEVIFSKTNASLWDTNGNGVGDGLEFIESQGYLGWIESLPDDWIGMTITWDNYTILVKTNSSVLEGEFDKDEKELKIKVKGPNGTIGVTEIEVPKSLCEPEDIEIILDGELINYTFTEDDTYYYIHIEYTHSTHELVADFSSEAKGPGGPSKKEKGLPIYLIALIVLAFIIFLILIVVVRNRGGKGDYELQELPPEKLSMMLEKKHADGEMTDETYEDIKLLLEKYRGS